MMRRDDIERRVNDWVFNCYDYEEDTMRITVTLVNRVIVSLIKEPGCSFECMIYDDGIEGDKELYLPNLCAFIEMVAERSVCDCIERHEF